MINTMTSNQQQITKYPSNCGVLISPVNSHSTLEYTAAISLLTLQRPTTFDKTNQVNLNINHSATDKPSIENSTQKPNKNKCTVCEKSYASKSYLEKTHMKLHTGEDLFYCNLCPGKSFAHMTSYKIHIRAHTKNKLFTCYVCDISFTQKHSLLDHERSNKHIRNLNKI